MYLSRDDRLHLRDVQPFDFAFTMSFVITKGHIHCTVLSSCSLGHGSLLRVVHNDFIQLGVDESAASISWSGRYDYELKVAKNSVPLYFIIIAGSITQFASPHALLVQQSWLSLASAYCSLLGVARYTLETRYNVAS